MSTALSELLAIADDAIDAVLPRLREARRELDLGVETKSTATDLVTAFDRWSEESIVSCITAARPDDGFIGEEGASVAGTTGVVWLIDPIDGTTNFVYDLPGSSVSIGASVDGSAAIGAVHDLVRDERFRATRGAGATLDAEPIAVSAKKELATALVATGFAYDADRRRAQAIALVDVLPAVRDIRRMGGAAVDLCSLACGRVDGYYERGLSPWDSAAGALIASEAGAVFDDRTDVGGALAGATPAIADEFFALLDDAGIHDA
ncbi:MAG: putative inositol-1-monophosphatase SuhB [Acidimicrobiales bacterium]|nr:MAG: putative inositol-1-monophosphatase SuhB [Acidimicrobiales bacterium]